MLYFRYKNILSY